MAAGIAVLDLNAACVADQAARVRAVHINRRGAVGDAAARHAADEAARIAAALDLKRAVILETVADNDVLDHVLAVVQRAEHTRRAVKVNIEIQHAVALPVIADGVVGADGIVAFCVRCLRRAVSVSRTRRIIDSRVVAICFGLEGLPVQIGNLHGGGDLKRLKPLRRRFRSSQI